MNTYVPTLAAGFRAIGKKPAITQLAYVGLCALVYMLARHLFGSDLVKENFVAGFLITAPIALAGARLSFQDTPVAFIILLRSIFTFATFYVVTSHVPLPDSVLAPGDISANGLTIGWIIASACGFLAWLRPSFGIVTLQYIFWQKSLLIRTYDIQLTHIDYLTLADTGSFLIMGLMLLSVARKLCTRYYEEDLPGLYGRDPAAPLRPLELLILAAVALHFGNYFYSAILKMALGDNALFWVLQNRTQFLIMAALQNNVMPLSFVDWLPQVLFDGFSKIFVLFNLVTLIGQAICILAITRVRWALLVTLFYDAMHIGIFLLTGIFFWKWIFLNFSIVAALGTFRHIRLPRPQRRSLVALLLISPFIFNVTFFGWLDSRAMNAVNIFAITDDGKEVQVPNNYFLGMSATFQQQRIVWSDVGPFRTWTWGTTMDPQEMQDSLTCRNSLTPENKRPRYFASKARLTHAIQQHHKLVLSLVDDSGHFEYDIFPHHIWSVPWKYREFRALDKRKIKAYRYDRTSMCLNYENGHLEREIRSHDEFVIPVAN